MQHIHPNEATIPMLIERLCDTDPLVRLAGYKKFHIVGPLRLKLGDRQQVLLTGFGETISFVKEYFINKMLPAWLTAFNGDFLAFLNGLNVDADEYDVRQTDAVCEKVLKVFFE